MLPAFRYAAAAIRGSLAATTVIVWYALIASSKRLSCCATCATRVRRCASFATSAVCAAAEKGRSKMNEARATINGSRVDLVSRRQSYNGFEAEFVQNLNSHIGIVASFSGTYGTTNFQDRLSGRTFRAHVQRYDLMVGPRYNWRTAGVTPFAHALFG